MQMFVRLYLCELSEQITDKHPRPRQRFKYSSDAVSCLSEQRFTVGMQWAGLQLTPRLFRFRSLSDNQLLTLSSKAFQGFTTLQELYAAAQSQNETVC